MKTLTWQKPGQQNVAQELIKIIINYVAELRVKIQNITIGYDLKKAINKLPLSRARVYVSLQNPFTFTNYSGLDPEIGYGGGEDWVSGIDLGSYPNSRSYMVGLNLIF